MSPVCFNNTMILRPKLVRIVIHLVLSALVKRKTIASFVKITEYYYQIIDVLNAQLDVFHAMIILNVLYVVHI